ncbi:NO-inducible flavohemoprotein [Bacillus suaedae]|uniref:Flavohemoprotein n=1 Tax=Halalkalibacter suaedae TaxID=2822140 RepID=A0A940WUD6_9BACI|nr:NO-inducible flavohemoprotein [Bacillus suaedae]MBP3950822.1 NO-inducible flavohemoprotein [Bacillus suaedae]
MLSDQTITIVKSTAPVLAEKGVDITTCFYKRLFENYPELLNIFNHANQKKVRQQTALANTIYAAALHIDQLEVLLPTVKQIAHKHRSLGVKAEHYPVVGTYLLKAIKEVLGEGATEEVLHAWGEAYGVIAQVFIDIESEMYEETASQYGGWQNFKAFKVTGKVKESSIITSFYLEPVDGAPLPAFKAGQYCTVRLALPGDKYLSNRQYSLSSEAGKPYFRISVKRENQSVPNGKISNYLHDHIDVGDEIELTAPAGDFTLDPTVESPLLLLSAGVGITPMIAMLKSVINHNPTRHITFLHATKNSETHAFHDELNDLISSAKHANLTVIYSAPTEKDQSNRLYDWNGYLREEILESLTIDSKTDCYLCGPSGFMKSAIEGLKQLGFPDNQIHYEFFGPKIDLESYHEQKMH